MLAPFASDASEYNVLQAGRTINIGYVPPQNLPRYTGAAFTKNGAPIAGKNAPALARNYSLDPAYPWGVNYFALNYTNPVSGPIFKQLYVRQAMQSLMNQTLVDPALQRRLRSPDLWTGARATRRRTWRRNRRAPTLPLQPARTP